MREKRWKLSTSDFETVRAETNGVKATFLYLEARRLKREGGATKAEMLEDLGFGESTLERSLGTMRKAGLLIED